MQYNQQQRAQAFKKLPKEVQEFLQSDSQQKAFHDILKKHNLHFDQMDKLGNSINLVTVGLIRADEFVSNFKEDLEIPDEKVQAITEDANNLIFKPLKEVLRSAGAEETIVPVNKPETSTPPKEEIEENTVIPAEQPEVVEEVPPPDLTQTNLDSPQISPAKIKTAPSEEVEEEPVSLEPKYSGDDPYREPLN